MRNTIAVDGTLLKRQAEALGRWVLTPGQPSPNWSRDSSKATVSTDDKELLTGLWNMCHAILDHRGESMTMDISP